MTKTILILVLSSVALWGCSSVAVVSETGNQLNVTVRHPLGGYDEAKALAGRHCERFGRQAQHRGSGCPKDDSCLSNFDCVE